MAGSVQGEADGVLTARYVLGLRGAQRLADIPGSIPAAAMAPVLEALLP